MKRLHRNKGDPSRTGRAVAAGAAVAGLLLILGGTQALSASTRGGARSGADSKLAPGGHGSAVAFLPSPSARRRDKRSGPGFAGIYCVTKEPVYCPTPPLLYLGGAGIQESPKLYLILWGKNWGDTEIGNKLESKLKNVYFDISGSGYQGILAQYFDTKGRIGSKVTLMTGRDTKEPAPTSVNDAAVQEEVSKAIATNKWTREFNAQFIVITAPGSTFASKFGKEFDNTDFCGYHSVTRVGESSYTFVPYAGDPPFTECAEFNPEKNAQNGTTSTATHEYAESATDPNPSSPTWMTSDGYEIGDICGKEDDEFRPGLWVQGQWDNYQGTCSLSDTKPAFVYAITEPASGVTGTSMELNGSVNPESMATEYHFEYGTTTSYTSKTTNTKAGSGRSNLKVKETIKGLTGSTKYHFRLVASNSTGTGNGLDKETKTS